MREPWPPASPPSWWSCSHSAHCFSSTRALGLGHLDPRGGFAFAIAYVRNSVTLARIFLREARRRRAASGEVGPAS
jgi:hypothetical protein